jgi:hypothetical protein
MLGETLFVHLKEARKAAILISEAGLLLKYTTSGPPIQPFWAKY